ncbi:MAG: serine hydrolase domain-containing protein [Gammaproteobacteria bacterium]
MARTARGKRAARIFLALLLIAAVLGFVYGDELRRVYRVNHLFDADVIVENFRSMDTLFPTSPVAAGGTISHFERAPGPLPSHYVYRGKRKSVRQFLEETWTTGLITIADGKMVYEEYFLGNEVGSRTISWSVAKSVVSALIGIAIAEGHISGTGAAVTDYVPELEGTGYGNVTIEDVLTMSSGVRFDEDYGDFNSDINRMGRAIAFNTAIDEFVASLKPARPPGTYHHYVSMDTQVLAMVLREATGESLSSYMQSRLWQPLGAGASAFWLIDRNGMELAFGCLNATLRDYARFGQLYLQEGDWAGHQIVPADWVRRSVNPRAARLQPGPNPSSDSVLGYGYQWWIPGGDEDDYLAIGIYNQFIYVNPTRAVVIAKSSAYPRYNTDGVAKELETIAMFRSIAEQIANETR